MTAGPLESDAAQESLQRMRQRLKAGGERARTGKTPGQTLRALLGPDTVVLTAPVSNVHGCLLWCYQGLWYSAMTPEWAHVTAERAWSGRSVDSQSRIGWATWSGYVRERHLTALADSAIGPEQAPWDLLAHYQPAPTGQVAQGVYRWPPFPDPVETLANLVLRHADPADREGIALLMALSGVRVTGP